MLDESDNSDSWGSLLINGILSKINQMSGKSDNDDHENNLLIGSMKPRMMNEVPKKVVNKKVTMKGQYPPLTLLKKKGENKFTPAPIPEYNVNKFNDWCEKRQKLGYAHKTVASRSTDFTEKKKVIKIKTKKSSEVSVQNLVQRRNYKDDDIKSSVENVQNFVQPKISQTTDLLEKDIKFDSEEENVQNLVQPSNHQVNPTLVDSFGGRRINFNPIQFEPDEDSLIKDDEIESSVKNNLVQPSKNQIPDCIEKEIKLEQVSLAPVKSSELSPAQVGNEKGSEIAPAQTDQKHSEIVKDDKESFIVYDKEDLSISHSKLEIKKEITDDDTMIILPPLSEFDLESDSEDEHIERNTMIKHKNERTITRVPIKSPS